MSGIAGDFPAPSVFGPLRSLFDALHIPAWRTAVRCNPFSPHSKSE
jgi:hypothetical protein